MRVKYENCFIILNRQCNINAKSSHISLIYIVQNHKFAFEGFTQTHMTKSNFQFPHFTQNLLKSHTFPSAPSFGAE